VSGTIVCFKAEKPPRQPTFDAVAFLGMGGPEDIMVAGREAVKAKVKELIQQYGFAGKAVSIP